MHVLMCRASVGFEHTFLPHAEVAIKKLGRTSGLFAAETTAMADAINAGNLSRFDVLVKLQCEAGNPRPLGLTVIDPDG